MKVQRLIFCFLLLFGLPGCKNYSRRAEFAFIEANNAEDELKYALELTRLHIQMPIVFFDISSKEISSTVAWKESDSIRYIEILIDNKKYKKTILNQKTVHVLMQE